MGEGGTDIQTPGLTDILTYRLNQPRGQFSEKKTSQGNEDISKTKIRRRHNATQGVI